MSNNYLHKIYNFQTLLQILLHVKSFYIPVHMYKILARIIHVPVNCILFRPQLVTDKEKISARIGTQDNDIKYEHQQDCKY